MGRLKDQLRLLLNVIFFRRALDKDKYNHITATYFLLAEIRLRKRREEQQQFRQNSLLPLGKIK